MMKTLNTKCYFSSLISSFNPNSQSNFPIVLNNNCEVEYTEDSVNILAKSGKHFKLKYKNKKIDRIYPVFDGFIIKFVMNSDMNDVFSYKDIYSNPIIAKLNYSYDLNLQHPLNKPYNLKCFTYKNHSFNEIIDMNEINILYSNKNFPFIISQKSDKLIINLFSKINTQTNKINYFLSQKEDTNNNTTQNDDYCIIPICDLISSNQPKSTVIYTSPFHEKNYFFAFEFDEKIVILRLKLFYNNSDLIFEKEISEYQNLIKYSKIDHFFTRKRDNLLIEEKEKIFYFFKDKILVLLNKLGYINFVEGNIILFKINLYEYIDKLFNCGNLSVIHDFKITKNLIYTFEINEKKNNLNLILNFNISSQYVDDLFKILRKMLSRKYFYLILEDFFLNYFDAFYRNFSENIDKDSLQNFIIFDYFISIFDTKKCREINSPQYEIQQNSILYRNLIEELDLEKDLNVHKYQQFFYKKLKQINPKILDFFKTNPSFLDEFTKILGLYYENIKIQNYNFYHKDLISFILRVVCFKNDLFTNYVNLVIKYEKQIPFIQKCSSLNPLNCEDIFTFNDLIHKRSIKARTNTKYMIYFNFLKKAIYLVNHLYPISSEDQNPDYEIKILKKLVNHEENIEMELKNTCFYEKFFDKFQIESHIQIEEPLIENNLFLNNTDDQEEKNRQNLFLILIKDFYFDNLKNLPIYLSIPITEILVYFKLHPNKNIFFAINKKYRKHAFELIDRIDFMKNYEYTENDNSENKTNLKVLEEQSLINNKITLENQSSNYEPDYFLSKIKFIADTRFKEILRILNPNRLIKVRFDNKFIENSNLESEKFNQLYKQILRQMSTCIGYGALNLNCIKSFPKDILPIKPLNLTGEFSHDESKMTINLSSDFLKEKDFMNWSEFHNGVSTALKLSPEFFTNKSYIRNWILFNKPNNPGYDHGGFILGMGLLKQLDALFATDVYQYMKCAHDAITIGMLLGRAASTIGSMDDAFSRTLCLHISFLIPPTLEIDIPINIQCASIIGIGLLYMNSANRLMTEIFLNRIGKKLQSEKNSNKMNYFSICLGITIGLINLGMGKINISGDLNLEEKLIKFINGGKKNDINSTFQSENEKIIYQIDNEEININLTAPAAFIAIGFIYIQTRNKNVANKIDFPKNLYELESKKPFQIYFAILTKNLILWDNILPNNEFIYSQIPEYIRFLYENKIEVIENDFYYGTLINNIDFQNISITYFYCITASIVSLGFKYAGTNNKEVARLMQQFLLKIKNLNMATELIIKNQIKFNNNNKFNLNKTDQDKILCILSYSLGIVMAGSGDLEILRIFRVLRKRFENDIKNYGYNQAIHQSIGFLFLGAGSLTFSSSLQSIAALYITIYPIFPANPNDNEKYLQAMKHFYVLACESRIIETRDIQSNNFVRVPIKICYNDGKNLEAITPFNITDFSNIKKIIIDDNNHLNDEISLDMLMENKPILHNKIIYVKRKTISVFNDQIYFGTFRNSMGYAKFLPTFNKNSSLESYAHLNLYMIKNLNFLEILNKNKSDNNSLDYIKKVVLNYIKNENIQVLDNNQKYKVLINKGLIILFVEFLKNENMYFLVVLIDNLTKILNNLDKIKKENFDDFKNMKFILNYFKTNQDNFSIEIREVYEELNSLVQNNIKDYVKEKLKAYLSFTFSLKTFEGDVLSDLMIVIQFYSNDSQIFFKNCNCFLQLYQEISNLFQEEIKCDKIEKLYIYNQFIKMLINLNVVKDSKEEIVKMSKKSIDNKINFILSKYIGKFNEVFDYEKSLQLIEIVLEFVNENAL